MHIHTFRLKPGQDLLDEIESFVAAQRIEAGCLLSSVGSLTHVTLRLADRTTHNEFDGHFEIISLNGTVSIHGSHMHLSIAGEDGRVIGGHLVSGCRIYTTAEIVIAYFEHVVHKREFAEDSGYEELAVYPR
ncbi:MAG TPA: PPC domain-containing DNA-binding protein [Pyrinomonadaceae bacterium]|nr:PPC domain-containing DNA-binding protein [Pyrinomonadaceae bacterium]